MTKTLTPYQQKLLDPRWQKKRLEILERDNWTCTNCGRTDLNLQVHHEFYSGNPWDIDSSKLKTLCYVCHEGKHIKAPEVMYMPKHTTPARIITKIEVQNAFDVESDIPSYLKFFLSVIEQAKINPPDYVLRCYGSVQMYIDVKEHDLNRCCLRDNILFNYDDRVFGIGDETKLVINER